MYSIKLKTQPVDLKAETFLRMPGNCLERQNSLMTQSGQLNLLLLDQVVVSLKAETLGGHSVVYGVEKDMRTFVGPPGSSTFNKELDSLRLFIASGMTFSNYYIFYLVVFLGSPYTVEGR